MLHRDKVTGGRCPQAATPARRARTLLRERHQQRRFRDTDPADPSRQARLVLLSATLPQLVKGYTIRNPLLWHCHSSCYLWYMHPSRRSPSRPARRWGCIRMPFLSTTFPNLKRHRSPPALGETLYRPTSSRRSKHSSRISDPRPTALPSLQRSRFTSSSSCRCSLSPQGSTPLRQRALIWLLHPLSFPCINLCRLTQVRSTSTPTSSAVTPSELFSRRAVTLATMVPGRSPQQGLYRSHYRHRQRLAPTRTRAPLVLQPMRTVLGATKFLTNSKLPCQAGALQQVQPEEGLSRHLTA